MVLTGGVFVWYNLLMNTAQNRENLVYEWLAAKEEDMDKFGDFYCPTRDVFEGRLNKMLNELLIDKAASEDDAYILSAIAGEIGNNSFDHNLGNWPDVPGIFFAYFQARRGNKVQRVKRAGSYDFSKGVKIVLADRGQGVFKTLKRVKPELQDDQEALRVAFTEKISGRAPESRGNGLKFVKESVESREIYLVFVSGNAQADLNEKMVIKKLEKSIQGCLAIISV